MNFIIKYLEQEGLNCIYKVKKVVITNFGRLYLATSRNYLILVHDQYIL